jgi:DNA-binding transcriptional ArsR family regulator
MVKKKVLSTEETLRKEKFRNEKKEIVQDSYCDDKILAFLLDDEIGFDKLVKLTGNSRGTVNTHMKVLYAKKLVQYKNPTERRGKSRPYCLTVEGRVQAEEILPSSIVRRLPDEKIKQLVEDYKLIIARRIVEHLLDNFFGYKTKERERHVILLIKKNHGKKGRERILEEIKAIESDLTTHGFSRQEIMKMWLIDEALKIQFMLSLFGSPKLFELLLMAPSEEPNLEDRDIYRQKIKQELLKY